MPGASRMRTQFGLREPALDGGQIVHQLLFSRHYVMDIIFRAVAALILVVLGALSGGRFTMFIAFGLFITLPNVLRVSEVSRELKREGFKPVKRDRSERAIVRLRVPTSRM